MHYHSGCMADVRMGDCRTSLIEMTKAGTKAQMCVTSPPYFGLRDYGRPGQLGLEETPEQYVQNMVEVFRCVRDVLADDGTLWLNIGDSYARTGGSDRKPSPTATVGNTRRSSDAERVEDGKRNRRSVWCVATRPYKGAHFATFPPALIEPCILAGSRHGDIVLDPFGGSGTTAGVALKHGRHAILCELNNDYAGLMGERIRSIVETK